MQQTQQTQRTICLDFQILQCKHTHTTYFYTILVEQLETAMMFIVFWLQTYKHQVFCLHCKITQTTQQQQQQQQQQQRQQLKVFHVSLLLHLIIF